MLNIIGSFLVSFVGLTIGLWTGSKEKEVKLSKGWKVILYLATIFLALELIFYPTQMAYFLFSPIGMLSWTILTGRLLVKVVPPKLLPLFRG